MNLRPGRERVLIKILPRPKREGKIEILERSEAYEAGRVLAVGEGCHQLSVGDLVVFHRAHLHAGSSPASVFRKLKEMQEEEVMVLKWFDIFFVIEEPGSVEVDGLRWQ